MRIIDGLRYDNIRPLQHQQLRQPLPQLMGNMDDAKNSIEILQSSTLLSKIVEIDGKHDNAIIAISSHQQLGLKQMYAKLHNADRCEI